MPHRSPSPTSSANASEFSKTYHQSTSAKLYNGITTLSSSYPSLRTSGRFKRDAISACLTWPLDRVNVLGDDNGYHVGGGDGDAYGHTGCVNALSWARDGELLLSGGDDRTVRVWRMDQTNDDPDQPFPFTCRSVIRTGHQANIFNNKMLPHSSRIVSCAGDHQVRVCDVGEVHSSQGCTTYSTAEACTHVIRCHRGAVKRIITEHSPDLFLSVSEDGTVRQHDLRAKHPCRRKDGNCPTPIIKVDFELMSMSLSPLTPHQLIVAGESDYGYLFDRRHSGRFLQEEWGVPPSSASTGCLTTCVRRFGRPRREGESEDNGGRLLGLGNHITGCKMSASNGHEAIFSFSADAVYLYSTLDDPADASASRRSSIVPSNVVKERRDSAASESKKRSPSRGSERRSPSRDPRERPSHWPSDSDMERDIDEMTQSDEMDEDDGRDTDESGEHSDADEEEEDEEDPGSFPDVPTVMPRRRFAGAKNIRTVKDVNYLGPSDEFVVSGSDDGNLFIWRKGDGKLVDILEGDGEVVNVIEGHPKLPLFAVSGIDTTVKLFAPKPRSRGPPLFSKLGNADSILEANSHQTPLRSLDESMLLSLAMHARRALGSDGSPTLECTNQ